MGWSMHEAGLRMTIEGKREYTNELVAGPTGLKNIFIICEEPCLLYELSIRIVSY